MTLDAAAASVGTTRQTWYDWESGRRIPERTYMSRLYAFTRGAVAPNDFYDLPPIGQLELPIEPVGEPSLFDASSALAPEPERLVA